MEIIEGKIMEFKAARANEFWQLLSPEKLLFPFPSEVLYRGQADATWHLVPSLMRNMRNNAATPWKKLRTNVNSDDEVFSEWAFLKQFVEHCDSIGLRIPNDSNEFRKKYFDQNSPAGPGGSFIRPSCWPF